MVSPENTQARMVGFAAAVNTEGDTMAWSTLWIIAYRDLGRNRRRSLFTLIAVALGLALLIVLNCFIAGVYDDALHNSIRLQTGHVQIRAQEYEEEKLSLQWPDLLDNPDELTARANGMGEVQATTPVLWAAGILNANDEAAGLRLYGIEPTAAFYAPIQAAMVAGAFLVPDDRGGIVIGKRLADSLGIGVGKKVGLTIVNADGQASEGLFTIRGLFATGISNYDESTVFMPLARAQAFAQTSGRVSAILILLHQQRDAGNVATALESPGTETLTWRDLNGVTLQTVEASMRFYVILDAIVMLIVAVILVNTLLMAIFERTREIGILAALGMKRQHILLMVLIEAAILGLAGIILGIVVGAAGVAYLAMVGIEVGDIGSTVQNLALSTSMHARFVPSAFASLSVWTLVIILLASLYPAWFAARLEPVEALHAF